MSTAQIHTVCGCGTTLTIPAARPGSLWRCPACHRVVSASATSVSQTEKDKSVADHATNQPRTSPVQALCTICQCQIHSGEEVTPCPVCKLAFHQDCWLENFGCSTYGCRQVGILKPPPITIATADVPPTPVPRAAHAAHAAPATSPPWDYLLLGGSAMAVLLGMMTFGLPCLASGTASVLLLARRSSDSPIAALLTSAVVSLIGVLLGIASSLMLWRVLET